MAAHPLRLPAPEAVFSDLLTDSRRQANPETTLFFAIPGERNDGRSFIPELYEKGFRNFVVQYGHGNRLRPNDIPKANVLEVINVVQALQALAEYHRRQFRIPVIAITGSNGKTIVKEWLSELLSPDFSVVKSPQSYNSQIGVPLSVWQMSRRNNIAVFEAGISKPGEMMRLEAIIKPDVGIITNIGTAHDEGFLSREKKTAEKLMLFQNAEYLFYREDGGNDVGRLIEKLKFKGPKLQPWHARQEGADNQGRPRVRLLTEGSAASYILPFADAAGTENILHAIAVAQHFGLKPVDIQRRILMLRNVAMRLAFRKGINNCYIIDDSYNNDLGGLLTALEAMHQKNRSVKEGMTLILSDMYESGGNRDELYKQIARIVRAQGISRFIGIGPGLSRHTVDFGAGSSFYPDTEAFLTDFPNLTFRNELILVKGARVFGFERIASALQEKVHGTRLEIDLNAVAHNLKTYRSLLRPQTRIMVMVKAFAYGSGSYEIANLLQFRRVDYLAVAYADEGVELRRQGITLPIMVMNPAAEAFHQLIQNKLEPDLYNPGIMQAFADYLLALPELNRPKPKIHLEFDTGMHRLGFRSHELELLIDLLKKYADLWEPVSVFSHLAGADEPEHDAFSHAQIEDFYTSAPFLEMALGKPLIKHILNSAGISRFTYAQGDMVRLGIGLYGIEPNPEMEGLLQPVGSLKTTISQIIHIKAGESVGYGRKGKAKKDSAIATIAIGYADGFSRRMSNGKGRVLVNNQTAPVIGTVCMDMTMIDITGIPASEGDEVTVFGAGLPISEMAKSLGTIPYEVLTAISERVKRVFFQE